VVSHIQFQRASHADRHGGLLGWASFELAGLRVDSAPIRRTSDGRVAFFWPEHVSRSGWRHAIVRPLEEETRLAIEREVIAELRRRRFIP
jgi:hypothetical protein